MTYTVLMRRILIAITLSLNLLGASTATAQAPHRVLPNTGTPAIVLRGLQVYARDGLRAALDVWLRGSPVESPTSVEQMVSAITPIEQSYGRMAGHEIVRVVDLSPSVRRVYAVLRYEKGPLYAFFDCYHVASGWIIPQFLTNTQAAVILPPDILTGSPGRPDAP